MAVASRPISNDVRAPCTTSRREVAAELVGAEQVLAEGGRNGLPTSANGLPGIEQRREQGNQRRHASRITRPSKAGRLRAKRRASSRIGSQRSSMRGSSKEYSRSTARLTTTTRHAGDEEDAEQQVDIARKQRFVGEQAESRPGEDRLDDHRAADQLADLHAGHGNDRQAALRRTCATRSAARSAPWRAR